MAQYDKISGLDGMPISEPYYEWSGCSAVTGQPTWGNREPKKRPILRPNRVLKLF